MSRLDRLLGLGPDDAAPARRLGAVIGLTAAAELIVEGVATSAFLARIGAQHLPTALGARALAEVVLSVGFSRAAARMGARRALLAVSSLSTLIVAGCAVALGSVAGVWAAYVAAAVLMRLKVIHFGVLALDELPGKAAARALPAVYACSRLGALIAGPVLALARFGVGFGAMLAGACALYAAAAVVLLRRSFGPDHPAPPSAAWQDEAAPPSTTELPAHGAGGLLVAIVIGTAALAAGRVALRTQSGAILESAYDEARLAQVLGLYFVGGNLLALGLQLGVVGRLLGRGRLPLLNLGWAALYLIGQSLLALGPAAVTIALSARWVESELRNAARTPVANLLYEALPAEQRPWARTLVIGVTVPLASLAAVALLKLVDSASFLAGLGVVAALILALAAAAQNRAWRRATR